MCWGWGRIRPSKCSAWSLHRDKRGRKLLPALCERVGEAVCWGDNDEGQANAPPGRFTKISAEIYHACALRHDGNRRVLGFPLGWPNPGSREALLQGYKRGREAYLCGLLENGDAICWGSNYYGQAGDVRGKGFVAISAGAQHTCALRDDGTGSCWGNSGIVPIEGSFHGHKRGRLSYLRVARKRRGVLLGKR